MSAPLAFYLQAAFAALAAVASSIAFGEKLGPISMARKVIAALANWGFLCALLYIINEGRHSRTMIPISTLFSYFLQAIFLALAVIASSMEFWASNGPWSVGKKVVAAVANLGLLFVVLYNINAVRLAASVRIESTVPTAPPVLEPVQDTDIEMGSTISIINRTGHDEE